ncbi:prepilin peptidase [Cohnella endophytica]|uniref:Prepilin peptidase n=1 Tax=Cohnella endophytica TaxID=2419778 RepID=A0A494Y563_9BACL|nr:A24 family peptidase [Cohnella endophytica]RKP57210.1 prepilin peptidase [Cohnella endophytica]
MTFLIMLYIFIIGLTLGSFYNVVAIRVSSGVSLLYPPSQCPNCGTRLKAIDLFPVASYLLAGRKCRYCKTGISAAYPLGELASGILFAGVYLRFGLTWNALIGFILVSLCLIVTISDLRFMRIPNRLLLFFAPLLVAAQLLADWHSFLNHLLGALVGGVILFLVAWLSRGGMGMGDVKLFALFGFVVGFPHVLLALMIACLVGTIVGGSLLALRLIQRKQPMPFGPFLAGGTIIAYGYGSNIVDKYLSIIVSGM